MDATVRVRSVVMFAGALLAVVVAAVVMWAMRVDAAPGESDTTFVPITACRLVDTRPGSNQVGPRNTPLAATETYTVNVRDVSTRCAGQVPSSATGLILNVTAAQTSTATFLTIWDQGPWPGTSSLNPVPGPPTPNAVTTKLSPADSFEIYNDAGTTHVIIDIAGYYTDASLDELDDRLHALETAGVDQNVLDRLDALDTKVAALEAQNATQESKIASLETTNAAQAATITTLEDENATQASEIAALESLTSSMTLVTVDGQPTVRFSDVNVQIVDGSNDTSDASGPLNGRGNLIVGYNENNSDQRTGSHNLIVGPSHSYTSYGSLIAGFNNFAAGASSSITGGQSNRANGAVSSIAGGNANTANGNWSSVTGGEANTANGFWSSVTSGTNNTANAAFSSVTGGSDNNADGFASSVTGGGGNTASGGRSSVTGGSSNAASGQDNTVAGGDDVLCDVASNGAVCGEYDTSAAPGGWRVIDDDS